MYRPPISEYVYNILAISALPETGYLKVTEGKCNQIIMKENKEKSKILSANFFPVVGVGASAGGLDAFKRLLRAIPENSGMAYVLVQHLDPSHDSLLTEILQKATNIPVLEISNDIKVAPNHIYVIPPNKIMVANDGVLELTTRPGKIKNAKNLPIDIFFTSLAEVHQSHAIGVVLSGTASDGTLGLKAIKDHGGITFAQDKESAAYEGMPHSAVQAGVVDFILPPEKIPEKLLELTKIISIRDGNDQVLPVEDEEVFKHIISLLRIRKATDFTYYKQTTIRRRILRRMALNKNDEPAAYLKYLRENKAEQDILYQDLLIPVTSFFRDPKIFENLCETVFPLIAKNKAAGESIRIWVAGCSTGEEAYSIAICIKEFLSHRADTAPGGSVQIFASDISEPAIAKARLGIYTKIELTALTPQQLKEFFTKTNGGYQVNKQVRDMCVFATHNFVKDPPFSKMDLISCRNVLIYMEPYLQKKALTTFHYALNPKAFLLLGKSETTSGVTDLFAPVAKNDKLFIRKDLTGRHTAITSQRSEKNLTAMNSNLNADIKRADFQKTADDIILSKYTPAGVIVNEAMDIVHFRGSTGDYLEPSPGKASFNLLKMVKPGLAFELRNILHKAKKDNAPVIKENIQLTINERPQKISIEAVPLPNLIDPHYLILFHNQSLSQPAKPQPSIKRTKDEKELRIRQLEQELAQTLEDMHRITEDQEAANEELQSANEELLSGSEELQSLNEELETSKEELQSTNEELTVVNQEMINLNEQVSAARDYAEAIIINIREPLLVLDKNLRIITVNNAFYKTFQVNEAETEGALIYDLGNKQWNIPALRTLLEKILPEKSMLSDFEVTHSFANIGDRTMLLNAREVINNKSPEKLILLSIEDITERVLARKKIEESEIQFRQLAKTEIESQIKQKQELEKAVLKRTYELQQANEALEEKNNELKKINKELESFTYVTSHDLQEPLRKIQTFASKILAKENQTLSEKGKDYFNRMQSAAARMQQLIEDLLAFSRINLEERNLENTDLNTIVEEVKNELAETIEEKHAIIEATELCPANIIPFQFRQLMHNLIGNALKFSKADMPPHIIINAKTIKGDELDPLSGISPEKNYCHITVADNGIGFDPQYKDQIFEVFQRLHEREAYPGTGIGLAIVKKIVQNHNGIITATSESGKGATFDIYIPAIRTKVV